MEQGIIIAGGYGEDDEFGANKWRLPIIQHVSMDELLSQITEWGGQVR